jgi:hypothetical protein
VTRGLVLIVALSFVACGSPEAGGSPTFSESDGGLAPPDLALEPLEVVDRSEGACFEPDGCRPVAPEVGARFPVERLPPEAAERARFAPGLDDARAPMPPIRTGRDRLDGTCVERGDCEGDSEPSLRPDVDPTP